MKRFVAIAVFFVALFVLILHGADAQNAGYQVTVSTVLNIRSGPGQEYEVTGVLENGNVVTVESFSGDWAKISYNSLNGYVNRQYLETVNSTPDAGSKFDELILLFVLAASAVIMYVFKRWRFNIRRKKRRDYYRNEYLQSEEWQRKRYVVLRRDNWRCVYCGARATQVHHKRYARNIGREPVEWLVSVCNNCHDSMHS
jgi:uncharacterized protein YraI